MGITLPVRLMLAERCLHMRGYSGGKRRAWADIVYRWSQAEGGMIYAG